MSEYADGYTEGYIDGLKGALSIIQVGNTVGTSYEVTIQTIENLIKTKETNK